ncbi:MAG TPA: ureidoglycolate lyase, partial [Acidimicrobiaceae bacterium]|nr:ureidoglycolate lyase [Acidimicrobiaceae bacterium]
MRLVRIGEKGRERAGVLASEEDFYDLSSIGDFSEEFFSKNSRDNIQKQLGNLIDQGLKPEKIGNQRWGAPIARPHQIICIGLNYADHAQETGAEIPSEPIIFTKSPNTLIGPYDNVHIPVKSDKTDWEVELAIVIGKQCRYLESEDAALKNIFGYMISNDISEREFQLEREGQWSKGKSCETFNLAG